MSLHTSPDAKTSVEQSVPLRSPARPARIIIRADGVPTLVRWSFLFLTFMFPFETAELGFTAEGFTSTRTVGLCFAALYFFYYNPLSQKRSLPGLTPALFCFLAYLGIGVLNGLFIPEDFRRDLISHLFTMVQMVTFFWIASSLLQDERVAKQACVAYAIASAILALGIVFEIPAFSVTVEEGRTVALGALPNLLALILVPASLICVGLYLNSTRLHFVIRVWLLVLALPMLVVLAQTGSRAGVGAFAIGSLLFLVPYRGSRRQMTTMALGIIGAVAIVYLVAQEPEHAERWLAAYYEGDTAGRDKIFGAAFEMISERPFFGWQPAVAFFELGRRLGRLTGLDAHNLVLYLLLEVGLVGAVPFMVGLVLCLWGAWKGRIGNLGIIPMVILGSILAFNMTHTGLKNKPTWLFLALGVAAGSIAEKQSRKRLVKVIRASQASQFRKRTIQVTRVS